MPLNTVKLYSKSEYYNDVYDRDESLLPEETIGEEAGQENITDSTSSDDLSSVTPDPSNPLAGTYTPTKDRPIVGEPSNFSAGLSAGIDQTQALGGGLKALAGSIIGKDDWVEDGMAYYQEQMAEAESRGGDVKTIEEIDSISDFGAWSAYTLGTLVPDIIAGATGVGLGATVVKAGIKTSIKKNTEAYAKAGADDLVANGVEREAADKLAKEVAEKYAEAKSQQYAIKGGVAGAVAYGTAQGSGNQFAQTLLDTGEEAPYISLTSGFAQGMLNALPATKVLTDMIPQNLRADTIEVIQEGVNSPWVGDFLRDVFAVGGVEGMTEGLQYIIEQETISYVNNNFTEKEALQYFDYLSNETKRSGLLNSAASGFLGGTTMGTASSTVKKIRGGYDKQTPDFESMKDVTPDASPQERLQFIADTFNKYKSNPTVTVVNREGDTVDTITPERVANPEQQQQIQSVEDQLKAQYGDSYDPRGLVVELGEGDNMNITYTEPENNISLGDGDIPPTEVAQTESTPSRVVGQGSREYGNDHKWDGELSDASTPIQDQLLQVSQQAQTPEALDPKNTNVVVEAIDQDDIDRVFDRNETLKIGTITKPKGKSLPTVEEAYGAKAEDVTNTVGGVMADLSANGVPRKFIDAVSGVFVHTDADVDAPALTGFNSRGISINDKLIIGSISNKDDLSELAWTMTHEVYHAADYAYGLSDSDDQLSIRVDEDAKEPSVVMGDIMTEIFDNWENGTPMGKRFDYPFNDLQEDINDLQLDNAKVNDRYRQEVFAQLGALFHSNPKQLQEFAPKAYNYIKGIRDNNLQTAQTEVQDEQSSSPITPETTQPTGISGEVRAPPESGSEQVIQPATARPDGEGSLVEGRADTAVEGSEQDTSGQLERPDVQEPLVATRQDAEIEAENLQPTLEEPAQDSEAFEFDKNDPIIEQEEVAPEKIKRGENFQFDGTYDVTYPDGSKYQMYRDSVSNPSEPSWNLEPSNYDALGLSFDDPARIFGIGYNRKEAVAWLNERVKAKAQKEQQLKEQQDLEDFEQGEVELPEVATMPETTEQSVVETETREVSEPVDVDQAEAEAEALAIEQDVQGEADILDVDDTVFIKKQDLSQTGQKITVSDVLYGDEKLTVAPPEGKKTTIKDIAVAMDARAKEANDGKPLDEETDENKETISDLIAHEGLAALEQNGNAGEWYQEKVKNAVAIAGLSFPEINAVDSNKVAFMSLVAVTSNGASVVENSDVTFPLYEHFQKTGRFKVFGQGKESPSMEKSFTVLNEIIDTVGIDGLAEFMRSEFTVGEMSRMGFKVNGEAVDVNVYGSAMLGPKIGQGFFQNLDGNFDPLTMDRWFMRTWGRLTGTMMRESEQKLDGEIAKFRKVALANRSKIKELGYTPDQIKNDDKILIEFSLKVYGIFSRDGFKDKSAINNASRSLKNAIEPREAPQNSSERKWIRSVFAEALRKVNENIDTPINTGALQALIWYPEKELYKKLGVSSKRSEPTDYQTEFTRIALGRGMTNEQISRAIRSAQQSGAGTTQRVSAGDVTDASQASGTERQEGTQRSPVLQRFVRDRVFKELRRPVVPKGGSDGDERVVPRRFRGRASRDIEVRLGDDTVRAFKRTLLPRAKSSLNLAQTYNSPVYELVPSKESAAVFAKKITEAKTANKFGAAVYAYPESDYEGMKLFLAEDGTAGVAVKDDGDIVSVFSDGTNPLVSYPLGALAIEEGGKYLDAFDTVLPTVYSKLGFKAVSRTPWNDEFAPEGWDKSKFTLFNNGEPDVVFMVHDQENFDNYKKDDGVMVESYDEAVKIQRGGEERTRPEQNRINQRMRDAVQARIDRDITPEELNRVFEEEGRFVAPMTPDMVPELPSEEKFVNALKKTNREKPNTPTKETYWKADVLEHGVKYGSRLDIPSYNSKTLSKEERVDIVTVHEARPNARAGSAGKRLGYYPTIRMRDGVFAVPEKGAVKIALGADKNTIATMEGILISQREDGTQISHEDNRQDFIKLINDPNWTQVSMNPERHSFYYDLEKQLPVVSFSEAIQVGNLVIVKDAEYADVEDFAFIKKKQINKELNKLDDGSPSTNKFSYNDEIDSQSDLARRLRDKKIYASLVDRYAVLQDFEEQAAEYLEMGRLPAAISPRDQENLSHGRVQKDIDEFHERHIDPIGDLIAELGYTVEAVDIYLIAKHAAERNDAIAEKVRDQRARNIQRTERELEQLRNDVGVDHSEAIATREARLKKYNEMPLKYQDTGSGMTYIEAAKVLKTAEQEGTQADLERIAQKVYDMLDEYRERMVTSGLLDQDTREDWEERFKFYVPLKGFAAEEKGDQYSRDAKSRGFSVVGKESMKARGRKTLPFSPLLTSFEDVQKKIIRARKNEYANTLLDLLSELGNSDSYTIYNTKFRPMKESDELTPQDLRQMETDQRDDNGEPKYVIVKREGQSFFIEFKSAKLNHALQNMSVAMLDRGNGMMDKVLTLATRFQTFRRNMLINYNPTWGLVNPMRDVATGMMYALGEMDKKGSRVYGKNLVGKMAQSYFPSMRSLWRYYRGKPARDGNEMDVFVQEYVEDGAPTGMMLMKDADEQLRILKNKLKRGFTREALRTMGKVVEDFNVTMENSIRFAAYVEARKAGVPREDAATLAKDLTVNFNRKGEDTAVVNAGYLFFNAAVQGNMNFLQTLQDDGGKGDKRTTAARKTALGLVALGSAITLFNILASEEDDDEELKYADLPEHAKNRALLFMYSPEEGFALQAPYGYNFFTNIGRLSTEVAMGIKDFKEAGFNLWENFLLNFVPVAPSSGDSWEDAARGFYPDLLELHLDLMANKNFFGSEIYIEQNPLFVERSAAYNQRRSTDKLFSVPAQFLNDLTGGDKYQDGYIALNPDKMQYIYEYFLGGVGRFASQTTDVISRSLADEEFRNQDLPIVGSFFESPSDYEDRFEFYANWEETRKIVQRFKEAQNMQEVKSLQDEYKPFLPLIEPKYGGKGMWQVANKDLRAISKARKLIEKQDYSVQLNGEQKKRELLDELEANENMIFDIFNKAYREAERR